MADLAERDRIETVHIVEVIQYRPGSRRRKVLILPAFQLNPSGLGSQFRKESIIQQQLFSRDLRFARTLSPAQCAAP
jgi:hypothetical protein